MFGALGFNQALHALWSLGIGQSGLGRSVRQRTSDAFLVEELMVWALWQSEGHGSESAGRKLKVYVHLLLVWDFASFIELCSRLAFAGSYLTTGNGQPWSEWSLRAIYLQGLARPPLTRFRSSNTKVRELLDRRRCYEWCIGGPGRAQG